MPSVPAPMFKKGNRRDPEPETSGLDTSSVAMSDKDEEDEQPVEGDPGPVELLEKF